VAVLDTWIVGGSHSSGGFQGCFRVIQFVIGQVGGAVCTSWGGQKLVI
jgi:hypothetical protein